MGISAQYCNIAWHASVLIPELLLKEWIIVGESVCILEDCLHGVVRGVGVLTLHNHNKLVHLYNLLSVVCCLCKNVIPYRLPVALNIQEKKHWSAIFQSMDMQNKMN